MSLDATINMLPEDILETILSLLPIEEAAKTSILSNDWRYKWTKIPKLKFMSTITPSEWRSASADMAKKERMRKLLCAMHQTLLQRQAPIHYFALYIHEPSSCLELDPILLHLFRNHTVKKFALVKKDYNRLPFSFPSISMHHLTGLYLNGIHLCHKPIFSGVGSLTILFLIKTLISSEALLHLLSNCPSLKRLILNLVDPSTISIDADQFIKFLPVIEHLEVSADLFSGFVLESVPRELPTSLIHLKYFCLKDSCFLRGTGLAFLVLLIKCSPNLEKLKLQNVSSMHASCSYETRSFKLEDYLDVWLEHLKEFEFLMFEISKHEMEIMKFVLARSPKLKKMKVTSEVDKDEVFEMLTNLLRSLRAPPVEIVVESWW